MVSTDFTAIYQGNSPILKIYQGNSLIWPAASGTSVILYTSTNGQIIKPATASTEPSVLSNTYINGQGRIEYDGMLNSIIIKKFYSKQTLSSIIIPNSVTSIGNGAFGNCYALSSVTLPSSLVTIEYAAFASCRPMTSITLPSSVTSIGGMAFWDCASLRNFTFQGTKSQWASVSKGEDWNVHTPFTVVHCTDGDVAV